MIGKVEGCSPGRRKAVHQEGGRLFLHRDVAEGCSNFYIGKVEGCSPCNQKLSRDLERRKASSPYMESSCALRRKNLRH